jgi:hypothetical protein
MFTDTRFAFAVENIRRRLKDFCVPPSNAPDIVWVEGVEKIPVDRVLFPEPAVLLFVLHRLCGLPLGYRGEKTHWIVPFLFRGVQCAIALEKFGVRLYVSRPLDGTTSHAELLGKLRKAVESAERHILTAIAQEQIDAGQITVANHFHRLSNQYLYFRERASICYSSRESQRETRVDQGLTELLNSAFRAGAEGAYNALAMVDAYYSRLEHLLVFALPFAHFDRNADDLTQFVGKLWSEKLKRVLDIQALPMQAYYDRLVAIKEKYRNTFAHGAFEKNGASFYFHLPDFGAVAASMSGRRHSVHFNLFPIESDSFKEICALFDEVDGWLKHAGLRFGWTLAESGLDLSFDEKSLAEMLATSVDLKTFEAWLDRESYFADMYANADY